MNRIRRIAAALAGLACACLGLAITAPAAFAQAAPPPGYQHMPIAMIRAALLNGEDLTPVSRPAAPAVTRIVVAGGMPGWQIALIATGAALLAAALAVLADRVWAAHRKTAPVQPQGDPLPGQRQPGAVDVISSGR